MDATALHPLAHRVASERQVMSGTSRRGGRQKASYNWAITDGTLPSGLALDSATGVIAGTPTEPTTAALTVQVTDTGTTTASRSFITIDARTGVDFAAVALGALELNPAERQFADGHGRHPGPGRTPAWPESDFTIYATSMPQA
jgi:hypothetical protein